MHQMGWLLPHLPKQPQILWPSNLNWWVRWGARTFNWISFVRIFFHDKWKILKTRPHQVNSKDESWLNPNLTTKMVSPGPSPLYMEPWDSKWNKCVHGHSGDGVCQVFFIWYFSKFNTFMFRCRLVKKRLSWLFNNATSGLIVIRAPMNWPTSETETGKCIVKYLMLYTMTFDAKYL